MTTLLESVWQDLAYALRTFRLNKGFAAVAMLSLALGIGANTAIFQLLDAVRLRSLPVPHPDQLARLHIAKNEHCCSGNFSDNHPDFTYPQWEQIRNNQQAFSSIAAFGDHRFNMATAGEPHYAHGLWVSGDFFKTMDVHPLIGRLIDSNDDSKGCASPNAVISYSFWRREFGGDLSAVGKQISLDGHKLDISGITPASFYGIEVGQNFDVYVPTCAEPLIDGQNAHTDKRHHWWLAIIGRLKPGWTIARASAQVNATSATVFGDTVPTNYRPDQAKYYAQYKLEANPAGLGLSGLREVYEQPLILLLSIAGLVLLIACSNLANLMLARASGREREMAVRLAIGANRGRLLRQLLIESLTLTAAGAALGAFLARFLSEYMVSILGSTDSPVFVDMSIDWRVLGFTAAVAILTCILFGLTPALRATRTDPASAMKAAGRGLTADRERFGARRLLVIAQVALSLVLLVGAFLFSRSLAHLLTLDAGFKQSGLLIVGVDASRLNYSPQALDVLYRNLLSDIQHAPGVEQASSANIVPLSGDGWNNMIEILGGASKKEMVPWFNRVSPGYFQTMGTPLLAGRNFDERDNTSSPEVAIVNQKFANDFLGNANPIGRAFRVMAGPNEPQHVYQIVGMVKNTKYQSLKEDPRPLAYVAQAQDKETNSGINLLVRSHIPIGSLMAGLRTTISRRNSALAFEFQSFDTQVQDSLIRERLMATLSGFFGFLAAVLATVGLYGVISYMVARRRSEIGIRIALGADRAGIVRLIVKEAVFLVAVGLVIGTALTAAMGKGVASFLYGLKPGDPLTIAAAVAALGFIGIAASAIPALRASRVEPMVALREE